MAMMQRSLSSYADAVKFLGSKHEKKIGHNTSVILRHNGIAVHYHNTDIVLYRPCGRITISPDGWHTSTTANRIDQLSPFRVTGHGWEKESLATGVMRNHGMWGRTEWYAGAYDVWGITIRCSSDGIRLDARHPRATTDADGLGFQEEKSRRWEAR